MKNACINHRWTHMLLSRMRSSLSWFIPDHIRTGDPDKLRRSQILVMFIFMLSVISVLFSVFYYWMDSPINSLINWVAIAFGFATLFTLRRTGSYLLAGNLLCAIYWVSLVAISCRFGGHISPTLVFYTGLPVVALSTAGRRSSIVWLVVAFLSVTTFYVVAYKGNTLPNDLSEQNLLWMSLLGKLGTIVVMLGLVWIYEISQVRLLGQVRQSEESLRESNAMTAAALKREKAASIQLEAAMEQLEAANRDIAVANQFKSKFLANMCHEIRMPMTAIHGFAENLTDPNYPDTEKVSAGYTIFRNSEHLLEIINDLLDISKVEAGMLEIECISCCPSQIIFDVQSLMRDRADAKGLDFNIEYEGAIPETIVCDPIRIKQILVNLTGNAIKFTETGSVQLVCRCIGLDGAEAMMQFDIIDTGIGIDSELIDSLFQPYTQADASTMRKFGGTGLGLAISKHLTEMLGGSITVASTPGQGSTFTVTIATGSLEGVTMLDDPASAVISQPIEDLSEQDVVSPLHCRILYAEDHPDHRQLISKVLRKAGADVTIVQNGKQAVAAALAACDQCEPFDVILMDMQMSVMDGYEATKMLRHKGYTGPIIALTAHAMTTARQECIEAGCDDYASKPINRKKLAETVLRNINKVYTIQSHFSEHQFS